MRTLIATLIALMLFATTPVAAEGFEDGGAAYDAGEYQKAFRLWKPLAEQGDMLAQGMLGVMYSNGKGVPKQAAYGGLGPRRHHFDINAFLAKSVQRVRGVNRRIEYGTERFE